MKRIFLLTLFLVFVAMSAGADEFSISISTNSIRVRQIRISPGDATNPQTFSFKTANGFAATPWTVMCPDGGAMVKVHGYGGNHPYFWVYIPAGTSMTFAKGVSPLDSVIVLRDATSSSVYITGSGKP